MLTAYQPSRYISINKEIYFFSKSNKLYWVDVTNWKVKECKLKGDILKNELFFQNPELLSSAFWDFNGSASCFLVDNDLYHIFPSGSNPTELSTEFITNELPLNTIITSLIYLPQKNLLLVGTDTKGLFVYREQKFKVLTYPNPERGTNNSYYFQMELDSDRVYTDWGREFTLKGGIKSKLGIDRNYSENVFKDKRNRLWYLSGPSTLKRFDPANSKTTIIDNTKGEFINCYFEEGDSMWIGTARSLGYVKNDSLIIVHRFDNNGSNANLFQVQRWNENKLWICSYTGVFMYDPITKDIDTLPKLYLAYPYNFSVHHDYLMIGTFGRGYYFYKNGRTVKMPVDANNYLQQSYFFIPDTLGYLWIATSNGIYKTRFSDLEKYFVDTTYKVTYLHYAEEDGITNVEFNGGCIPPYVKLKNGYYSMPNVEGLVWFKPTEIKNPDFNGGFFWDGFYQDDKAGVLKNDILINNSTRVIKVDFSTPFWGVGDNLTLEYKLDGFNPEWIPIAHAQNSLTFSNLPSGKYALHLRKRTGFDPNDYLSTTFEFRIEKRFVETFWFIALCLVGGMLFSFIIARLYAYNINKRNIALEKNVQLRTIELMRANEELKQSVSVKDKLISILTHDIITPLRFITLVARKGADKSSNLDPEKTRETLKDIKNSTEKLHDNAQNILNWIKNQNKRITVNFSNVPLSALADEIIEILLEMAQSKGTKILNHIPVDDIIKSDKNILSIVLHNLISNATKFTPMGSIVMEGKQIDTAYHLFVKDTGKGMHPEQLERIRTISQHNNVLYVNPASGENGNGLGYLIVTEMVDLLGGQLKIESAPGKGTTVEIILPLQF